MIASLLLVTLAGTFTSCIARKDGAPPEACSTLLPHHGHSTPQEGDVPYTVSAHSLGDNKINVMISSPTGESFKGFILQARSANNREMFTVGEFKTDDTSKGMDCEGQEQGTLTHVNNEPKTKVSTEWIGTSDEDVIFRATVVKAFNTFWTNIDSDPVTVKKRETEDKNISDHHEINECVENNECKVLLQFKDNQDGSIQFSLSGALKESEYMAMGISKDGLMGEDFVTECIRVGQSEIRLRKSWNEGKMNLDTTDISPGGNTTSWRQYYFKNGKTTCIWNEEKVVNFNGKTYDLTSKPYILLAHGPLENNNLRYHHSRIGSKEPVDLYSSGSLELLEYGGGTTDSIEEPTEKQTKKPTPENKKSTSSCSQLNFSLFGLSLFVVLYRSGRMY